MDDLHEKIMNIPCDESRMDMNSKTEILAYKMGHRDARHAAAELVAAALSQPASAINAELLGALQHLFNSYKSLADSGDAGNWKLEEQPEGIKALAAIAKAAAQGDSSHSSGGECGGMPQWRPIETAPKDGSWIVVLGCYPHSGAPETVRWFEDHWSIGGDGYPTADPVQWMPLPPAPKSAL